MSICDSSRANPIFKILGFVCKRFLPSSPPPLSLIFCSRPIYRAAKTSKSRSSDFFCSETPRKRLLRRLNSYRSSHGVRSTKSCSGLSKSSAISGKPGASKGTNLRNSLLCGSSSEERLSLHFAHGFWNCTLLE